MKTKFIDESMDSGKNKVVKNLEPKMLPVRFRERTTFSQRIYLFLIVLAYALAVGVISFTLLAGLAEKMNNVYKEKTIFLILTMSISIVALFSGSVTPNWTRNRKNLYTFVEFISVILSPIIFIGSYTYLSFSFNEQVYINDPKKLLFVIGLITLASNLVPILFTFCKTIFNRKRYRISLQKTFLISFGNIIISATNLSLWLLSKYDEQTKALNISNLSFIITGAVLGAGLLLSIIGIIISLKWDISGARSIWTSVRISGALPSLVVYSALLAIGLRFMKMNFSSPVILTISIDAFLLAGFLIYVWFKGRISNLIKTNPIYNNVILKVFTILVAFVGMMNIAFMEQLAFLKDYGPTSFEILGVTSITIILGVFIAHIGRLITYSKMFRWSIIGSFGTLVIVMLVILSIIILKNSEIILAIISKQLVSLFLIIGFVIEILLLFIDISITAFRLIKNNKDTSESKKRKKGVK